MLRLSWPIAISMVSYAAMTLVDTLFVGWLGPEALAGVGIGGMAAFTLIGFMFGLLRGVKVLTAQGVGAGRQDESRDYLAAGLAIALSVGLVLAGLGQLIAQLLPLLTASAASGAHAETYLAIRILGSPLVLVYVAIREHRYGIGDSRSPMVAAVVGNVVNIGLDYLTIVVLGWGVAGAAAATVVGQGLEAAILIFAQRSEGLPLRGVSLRSMRAVLRVGLPTGVQFLLEIGAFAVMAGMLAALSDVAMAAHQIVLQAIHFTFLPILAFGEAAAVMVGQAVGARRDGMVRGIAFRALLLGGTYALFWTVGLALWSDVFVGAFTDDRELIAAAIPLFWVAACFQILDAANVVARSALQGTGDVRFPAAVGIVTAWLMTPPATYFLGYEMGLGALGGWLGIAAEIGIGAVIFWWRLLRGGWHEAAARTRAEVESDSESEPAPERVPAPLAA
jgi:MATE family multidrug resistance protein